MPESNKTSIDGEVEVTNNVDAPLDDTSVTTSSHSDKTKNSGGISNNDFQTTEVEPHTVCSELKFPVGCCDKFDEATKACDCVLNGTASDDLKIKNSTDPAITGPTDQAVNNPLDQAINGPIEATTDQADDDTSTDKRKSAPSSIHYDRWLNCKEQLEQCLTMMKVSDHDKKTKTYDELCKMLAQPTALYKERKRFYEAKRKYYETTDDYLKRLKELSSTCQFDERQDVMLADKLIVGQSGHILNSVSPEIKDEIGSEKALETLQKYNIDPTNLMTDLLDFDLPSLTSSIHIRAGRSSKVDKNGVKNVPPHLVEVIRSEIMEENVAVGWDEIAGLDFAKSTIQESVVWPLLRPDIFTGLRNVPKAVLLFGPPGCGKTTIGKSIASQTKSTFFYLSASTLTSKWYGESEKLVAALFKVAVAHQPSVIFFDEIDSLLTRRSSKEHDINRRIKTEFMVHLDGANTKENDRVLFIGATNRPQDLDEAARRRFAKRLYVPLPDTSARKQLLNILLKNEKSNLNDNEIDEIVTMTNEFSGADMKCLCQDASMQPLRSITADQMATIDINDIRPLNYSDFSTSLARIRPSLSTSDLTALIEWDRLYGSSADKANDFAYKMMYT